MPSIDLPGCVNARDVGGTPLRDGTAVPMRALLRSDNHNLLTAAGIAAVRELGVVRILDVRHDWEADLFPSPFKDDEIYRNVPVLGMDSGHDPTAPDDYRTEVDFAPAHVAAAFTAFAEAPPGPVLVHCHGGRDRAGILTAIALAVAGAPHADITADYALTPGTDPRTMRDLLAHFDTAYGGLTAYLREAGVQQHHLDAVAERLSPKG